MENFEGFNLNKVKNQEEQQEKEPYVSSLGNFTELQEKVILFGRDSKMTMFFAATVLTFLLSIASIVTIMGVDLTFTENGVTQNLNWVKAILVIAAIVGVFSPLAVYKIWNGSRTADTKQIRSGLRIATVLMQIGLVFLVIGAVIAGIGFLFLLTRAFIFVVILGGLMFGLFYVLFKFFSKAISFLEAYAEILRLPGKNAKRAQYAEPLKGYLIFMVVLMIIGFISDLAEAGSLSDSGFPIIEAAFMRADVIGLIQSVISIFMYILLVSMTTTFDSYVRSANLPTRKPNRYSSSYNYDRYN